jgi:hypothetical protein
MLFGMPCTLSHPNSRIALRYKEPKNSSWHINFI